MYTFLPYVISHSFLFSFILLGSSHVIQYIIVEGIPQKKIQKRVPSDSHRFTSNTIGSSRSDPLTTHLHFFVVLFDS